MAIFPKLSLPQYKISSRFGSTTENCEGSKKAVSILHRSANLCKPRHERGFVAR